MTRDEIQIIAVPHLRTQFELAFPILFTGAGFSQSAKTRSNVNVPSYLDLKRMLWSLCFQGATFEPDTSLQDLYETSLRQHRKELAELMIRLFTVDADSLPGWYEIVFSMPWARCYTVNIDDLAQATNRKFNLPRPIVAVSATSGTPGQSTPPEALAVIHLNGALQDAPDGVTFSITQYAERLTRPSPWYMQLAANLVSHPIVFIGTRLDEPPLWQHLELRKWRGIRGTREMRPRSYLVTPDLPRARQSLLAEFNVEWVPMTAEEFAVEVLSKMKSAALMGLETISRRGSRSPNGELVLPEIAELASSATQKSEFLLGQEPIWADLHSGRAILRESDEEVWAAVQEALRRETVRGVIVFTGTAGSGKSTALMRAALRLVADGVRVGWVGRDTALSTRDIRQCMRSDTAPAVLAIDDSDLLGFDLGPTIHDVCLSSGFPLVLLAIRSSRLDSFINPARLEGVPVAELTMPHLTDADIGALLDVLDRENRLGLLKGKGREEQEHLFRQQAGRQLLVAMIQATSGRRFEEKVIEELEGLEGEARYIYALIAVASNFRFALTSEDILIGCGDRSNQALNIIDQLARRNVVIRVDGKEGLVRARHRVIAEIILNELQKTGQLAEVLIGLTQVAAIKVNASMPRSTRPWRLLRSIISHDFLKRTVNVALARNIYGSIEQLLSWDSHYWLQRGSLEVEVDEVSTAENFLNQAKSLAEDDPLIETEWAYLLFRKAILSPGSAVAPELAKQATASLEDLIERRGRTDPYPYHVLGSQGLSWSRRGISLRENRATYLRKLVDFMKQGCERHPKSSDLASLRNDLQGELLSLAIPDGT